MHVIKIQWRAGRIDPSNSNFSDPNNWKKSGHMELTMDEPEAMFVQSYFVSKGFKDVSTPFIRLWYNPLLDMLIHVKNKSLPPQRVENATELFWELLNAAECENTVNAFVSDVVQAAIPFLDREEDVQLAMRQEGLDRRAEFLALADQCIKRFKGVEPGLKSTKDTQSPYCHGLRDEIARRLQQHYEGMSRA